MEDSENGVKTQSPVEHSKLSDDVSLKPNTIDILGNGLVLKRVLKEGLGQDSRPNYGDSVVISYQAWLEDGCLVEEAKDLCIVIGDGDCIHAFDLALPLAELKESFELKTDSRFGYGELGKEPHIPAKANLTYHITLEKCEDPPCYEKMSIEQRFQISDKKRDQGNFYFRRCEFQYALPCYTKALEILKKKSEVSVSGLEGLDAEEFPPCTPAQLLDLEINLRNNVAVTQLKLAAFVAAAKTCDTVLQLDPNNRKALYRKAQALVGTSDLPEAIKVFEEALRLSPTSVNIKCELQKTKAAWKQQRDKHMRALSRAFKQNPKGVTKKSGACAILSRIWSRYKLAISAVLVAGVSVTIGAKLFNFADDS